MKTKAQIIEQKFVQGLKNKYLISEQTSQKVKEKLSQIKVDNPITKRKNNLFTVLADKTHPAYNYAKNILKKIQDQFKNKFKKTKEETEEEIMPSLKKMFDMSKETRDRDREITKYTAELARQRKLKSV